MNRFQKPRGGAAVETAIMMVFLVPTIMYALFLQDTTWYKLEQEETIISVPWDYAFLDWNQAKFNDSAAAQPPEDNEEPDEDSSSSTSYDPSQNSESPNSTPQPAVDDIVAHQARRTYCDHTSAYDSMNPTYECGEAHHTNFAAHQCWLTGAHASDGQKGLQVSCWRQGDSVFGMGSGMNTGIMAFTSQYNAGGYMTCTARLGVTNYFVMNEMFLWSRNKVTELENFNGRIGANGSGAHSNAQGASRTIVFIAQKAAVLHDSWAVNRPANIDPTQQGDESRFQSRMNAYYTGHATKIMKAFPQFWQKLTQDKLIGYMSAMDGSSGDNLFTPPLAWKSDYDRKFGDYGTSGWGNDDRQSDTHSNLENKYFGGL